jgi:hypothetical protein
MLASDALLVLRIHISGHLRANTEHDGERVALAAFPRRTLRKSVGSRRRGGTQANLRLGEDQGTSLVTRQTFADAASAVRQRSDSPPEPVLSAIGPDASPNTAGVTRAARRGGEGNVM